MENPVKKIQNDCFSKIKRNIRKLNVVLIRKYTVRWYILGLLIWLVLMHTNAWDQHWGGDETLKCGFKID